MREAAYGRTVRQDVVLDVLVANAGLGWMTCAELVNEIVSVPCDPCDATGEGLCQPVCPACHGDGWRELSHVEVEQTLGRLCAMGLVGHREHDPSGSGLCTVSTYTAPLTGPGDPLEKLWAL